MRARVATDLETLRALLGKFKREDTGYADALQAAHRVGPEPPKDERTPEERRLNERSGVETSLWAGCNVLAEVVDRANRLIAENEARWLADIRSRDAVAHAKVEEAARLLQEAQSARFHLARLGGWVKQQGGPFGAQPVPPEGEPVPDLVDVDSMFDETTRRPWHQARQEPLPPPHPGPVEDDLLGTDVLDEGEAIDLIEPLSPDRRFGPVKA